MQAEAVQNLIKHASEIHTDGLEDPRKLAHFGGSWGHFWSSAASWVRFALPEGLGAVSGAVLGGSWALLGAVLACPGRQLGAKLAPKRAPEADKNDLEN